MATTNNNESFLDRNVSMTNTIIATSTGVLVGGTAGFFIGQWYERRQKELANKPAEQKPAEQKVTSIEEGKKAANA